MLPRGRFHSISDDHLIEGRTAAVHGRANAEQLQPPPAYESSQLDDWTPISQTSASQSIRGTVLATTPLKTAKSRSPSLNIHSEHLDIELVKYLYQVYFHKKILRYELEARKMKRQSEQSQATQQHQLSDENDKKSNVGASTPKRMPSLLRVTYFDDFDLFRTGPTAAASSVQPPQLDESKIGRNDGAVSKLYQNNKSSSANDLEGRLVFSRIPGGGVPPPGKSQSLDKSYERARDARDKCAVEVGDNSLSETATAPGSACYCSPCATVAVTSSSLNKDSSVANHNSSVTSQVESTASSSTEIFESSRSFVEQKEVDLCGEGNCRYGDVEDEGEFETPPHSRDSSSCGLVSCASKVEDSEATLDENNLCDSSAVPSRCDAAAAAQVLRSVARVSSDLSTSSSVEVSATTTLRSSVVVVEQPVEDCQCTVTMKMSQTEATEMDWVEDLGSSSGCQMMTVASSLDNVEPSCGGDNLSASTVKVLLERAPETSFGICIVGGQVNISGNNKIAGVFIKNIIPGSPADKCNVLQVGDRILAVDDTNLKDSTHQYAVSVIKNAGLKIRLVVERFNKWQNDIFNVCDNDDKGLMLDKCQPPPVTPAKTPECIVVQEPPTTVAKTNSDSATDAIDAFDGKETIVKLSDDKKDDAEKAANQFSASSDESSDDDDEEDSREMTGRIYTKAGIEIDRASAGNVKLSKTEQAKSETEPEDEFGYNAFKLRKRYGALGTVVQHSLPRNTKSGGTMGISLAGHRDRNKMACFIAGINPRGFAALSELKVGDEILEVNGIVLHGRSHLNASAIIKNQPGPMIKFILLRREPSKALEELAVKPVTQFPIDLETEADAIAGTGAFKNVRLLTMTKAGPSLGIMIIEGKHSEMGQGIFVSDIQEGSVAEVAGLGVGDMILSVNGDSLLNCNYETAAGMLKKTEGLVNLKVCNPNKSEDEKADAEAVAASGGSTLRVNDDKSTSRRSLDRPGSAAGGAADAVSVKGAVSTPVTPKSHKSNKELSGTEIVKEVTANKECVIEVHAEKKLLGLICVGGKDSSIKSDTAVVVSVLSQGAAKKDGRLKAFDQILEINGVKLTGDKSSEAIQKTLKIINDKITLTVWRADPVEAETVDVELTKKSGKDVGICCGGEENGYGVVVTDVLAGSVAEADGRIQKGDIISHVNGDQLANQPIDLCSVLLKTALGKVALKVMRPAPKAHR